MISEINSSVAQFYFSKNNTFIMGTVPSNYKSIPSIIFQSFVLFNETITNGTFPKNVKAVIYDCEKWNFTPIEEQINPPFEEFASLAHKHNLTVIFTPGDLTPILYNGTCKGSTGFEKYLNCSIPYRASLYGDIFEIQAQGAENNPQLYYEFVKNATLQAKKANPNIIVVSGLSTGPSGQNTSSYALYNVTMITQDIVDGYWLNIPQNSPYCPKCTTPKPQIAVDYLIMLSTTTTTTTTSISSKIFFFNTLYFLICLIFII